MNKRRILLVDDDAELRRTLVDQLNHYREFDIVEAGSGAEALSRIREGHADLMLLDVGLPDMDGREAVKILRREGFKSPILMLTGPIPATAKVLQKANLTIDDIDLVEINEAFASVVLAWQKATGADLAKVNVNGGAVALGHPLGASGARITTMLLHELERSGGRYGLQTICEGGGTANAMIIERI